MRYLKTTTIIGLSLLFVACQKEDVAIEVRKDPTMMSFEPQMDVSGAVTRGTPITAVSQMIDMGVFVYHTDDNQWATAGATATPYVMNNQQVKRTGSTWSYAPIQQWQGLYNTLFAYAPYATTANGITVQTTYTGAPTIEYTVPTTCVNQPDLMVSARQEDKYLGTVSFAMEHALACVGFKVNGRYEETITKIAIKGASVSGTLNLDHITDGVPQWTSVAAATDTEYTPGIRGNLVGNGTMMDVMTVDGYLMMIPQTLGAGAKLIITVDGVDKVAKLDGVEWKAGERYTYNVDILHNPIDIGYFGGWDDVNKVYTKRLQVDWELQKRESQQAYSTTSDVTGASDKHYGLTNVNTFRGLSADLSNYPAAQYCYLKNDKNKDGLVKAEDGESEEWYFPSQNQMMAVWLANEGIPSKFRLNYLYLSSTEDGAPGVATQGNGLWTINFNRTGETSWYSYRSKQQSVRCVRDLMP